MNGINWHELIDDSHDPVARALQEQAPAARMTPPSQLRQRTVAALYQAPVASHSSRIHRPFITLLAAAALIGLAVVISISVKPRSPGSVASNNDGIANDPSSRSSRPDQRTRTFMAAATVQLAAFTQPLEQETQALTSDLKRAAYRFRGALPGAERRESPKTRD